LTRYDAARYASIMTVVVTGAAGFIGRHLLRSWPTVETIVGIDKENPNGGPWPQNVDWRHADLGAGAAVERLFLDLKPRLIIHLAGISHTATGVNLGSQTIGINVDSTMNVLLAAAALRRRGSMPCKMIIAGSAAEYGDVGADGPLPTENAMLRPGDPYAKSKVATSMMALGFGLRFAIPMTVLRLANVYGPGQSKKLVPTIIENLLDGKRVTLGGQGTPTRQWIYVDDVVSAIKHATSLCSNSLLLNIGHPDEIPIGRVAFLIAQELEGVLRRRDLLSLLNPVDEGGGAQRVAMDVGRFESALGWKAKVNIEDGLRATVAAALKERGIA
jgi:dTDP-glucose 4,6-dehydratase